MKSTLLIPLLFCAYGSLSALTINADFSRDITGQNPGTNPAGVLQAASGPAPDTRTVWNDLKISLPTSGDQGTASILHPLTFNNLKASDGTSTAVDVTLSSGFYRAFNTNTGNNLQREWIFAQNGNTGVITVSGLDPAKTYDLYLVAANSFSTTFTVGGVGKTATGAVSTGTWTSGSHFVSFTGLTPDVSGNVAVSIRDSAGLANGAISGLQIVTADPSPRLFYPGGTVATTGGRFSTSGTNYLPSNLVNNGFTSPSNTISTATDYLAPGNNYATASGTLANFDLTFDFAGPATVDGLHVWNYAFRNGAVNTSPISGVNSYSLTFYSGTGGTGAVVGDVVTGNLAAAVFGTANPAQSVYFGSTYANVRSVVLRVLSNHGSPTFTGLNEVAFNGPGMAPTDLPLNTSTVAENNTPGATVGTLSATDADPADSHTFSLVSGLGSDDNSAFTLIANTLSINSSADFEAKPSYSLRVRATDSGALTFEKVLIVSVTDIAETAAESWRETFFGSPTASGNATDTADPDGDNLTNLMEFAIGTNPTTGSGSLQYAGTLTGGGSLTSTGQPITLTENIATGADFRGVYSRRKDYLALGLTITPQFSNDLTTWENSPATPAILADDGTNQIVSVPFTRILSNGKKARFFRLSVSSN